MKRPLCLVCLLFAAVLAALFYIAPPAGFAFPDREGGLIHITGRVGQKEYGPQGGTLCLTNITNYSAESAQYFQNNQTKYEEPDWSKTAAAELPRGVLCYFPENAMPEIGQWVRIGGRAQSLRKASNPGAFNQDAYYRLQGVDMILKDCSVLESGGGRDGYREALFQLRCYLEETLYRTMDEQNASILSAMLLGSKKGMDSEVKQLYQAAGIAHVLAISGLHISFLGLLLYRMLQRLGCSAKIAALFCLPFLYSYGILTGAGASGRRAVCMFILQLGAVWLGRTYDMITALAAAALLLLFEQPLYLFYSGFQLSFGAILGLGILLPLLKGGGNKQALQEKRRMRTEQEYRRWLYKTGARIRNAAADSLLASLSVTLATLPVLIQNYYEFPPYAIVLNLGILPLMGLLLPAGFSVLLLNRLPVLTWAAAFLCAGLLKLCELLCRWTLFLPGSRLCTGHAQDWQVVMYYGILLTAIGFQNRFSKAIRPAGIAAAMVVLLIRLPGEPLQIHMVDVGQGDCFFLQMQGSNVLIDGGSSSQKQIGTWQITPLLRYYGVTQLDYVFLTHLDADHYNGIAELLEQAAGPHPGIIIRNLVLPANIEACEKSSRLAELTVEQGGRVCRMEAGEKLAFGDISLSCLHPLPGEQATDSNDSSLVLSVEYDSFRALFMGDLSMAHETEVIRRLQEDTGPLKSFTLLKAGHHGSADATGKELLREIQPLMVLLSYGRNNSYGHPHPETMERIKETGAKTFATPDCGEVTVTTNGRKVRVESFALQP